MEFEDRRGQILRILPKDLRRDAFRRLADFRDVSSLKEWIREQLEYEKEWGLVDKGNTVHAKVVDMNHGAAEGPETPESGELEAFMAANEGTSDQDILAVLRKFQRFSQQRNGKGNGAAATQG